MSQILIEKAIRFGAERCIGLAEEFAKAGGVTTSPKEFQATITIPGQDFTVVVLATVQPKAPA